MLLPLQMNNLLETAGVPAPTIAAFHTVNFESVSQIARFTSTSQLITIESSEPVDLSFLVKEDGDKFLFEDGRGVLRDG